MSWTFKLPDLGEGLAEAELLSWHVEVGHRVQEDQDLVDVQTDKAIMTVPCPVTGTLLERCGDVGDVLAVGAPLAVFDAARPTPAPTESDPESTSDPEPPASVSAATPPRRPAAAPSVRRRARELGIDLAAVSGSGPGGRILAADLVSPEEPRPTPAPGGPGAALPATEVPLRGLRRTTAAAMTSGWQSIPHMFDFREADASALERVRKALREEAERDGDSELAAALSPVVLLAKIAAVALERHPEIHGYVDEERQMIVRHGRCDLGIAAATPDGLLAPVLRNVGGRSIPDLARDLRQLVNAARARTLGPEHLTGATFLLNNLGALGSRWGTPLIPPGLGGNFAFGRVEHRPVVRDGEVVAAPVIPLSTSADHRLVDGDVLAAFAGTVVRLIETPTLLLGARA